MKRTALLEKVSELDIFLHFIDDLDESQVRRSGNPGRNILSPFKDETHPSCSIYENKAGKINYKCHSAGLHGDCFQLVADLNNLDCKSQFNEVLKKINDSMKLGLEKAVTSYQSNVWKAEYYEQFTKKAKDFWMERNVDTATLEKYSVRQLRLNNLHSVFPVLCWLLIQAKMEVIQPEKIRLYQGLIASVVDSMPIIMAKGPRSFGAKVAPEYCNKGYCATKKLHYYGLKLHVMGFSIFDKLPLPEYIGTSPASNNDLTVFKPFWEVIHDRAIFADKAYANQAFEQWLMENNNVQILTPVKKKKGQKKLEFMDKMYSRAVSQIRQPIESFFNWIIEKVGIQNASKVRSEKGLFVHVYGRFAAALMIMTWDIF